jgi:hypothetical protein
MRWHGILTIVLAALLLAAGCRPDPAVVERLEGKLDHIQATLVERAVAGEDVSDYLARMHEAKAHFDKGEVAEGEAIMDAVIAALESAQGSAPAGPDDGPQTGAFGPPQLVTILGYDESLGAMEPFLARDGRTLLFNSQHRGKTPPDLYWAERIDDRTFRFRGEIGGANSDAVDGAPSMDRNGRLYFISPRDYARRLKTIHTARFEGGSISGLHLVDGDVAPGRPGWLNMDAEISADGRTLYYCVNEWNTRVNLPKTSDLRVARLTAAGFETAADSADIFRTVNSGDLEYAPALSADERELFFTRARFDFEGDRLVLAQTAIMMASRKSAAEPFGPPVRIAAITGFVEGPTISPDGRLLYYHRRDSGIFHLYMVERRD